MKTNTPAKLTAVSAQFLTFTTQFLTCTKAQYQQQNLVKANTQGFQLLFLLKQQGGSFTMSELAGQLHTTKQQLTRLVNALEEKRLVMRSHDTKNRRLVYVSITPEGIDAMEQLKESMLEATKEGLSSFTSEELAQLSQCLDTLSSLMPKFNPDFIEKNILDNPLL